MEHIQKLTTTDTTPKKINKLTADDFVMSAQALNAINYIIQDMQEEFFSKFDSTDKDYYFNVGWEFPRNRARLDAISILLETIAKDFKKANISCYNDDNF